MGWGLIIKGVYFNKVTKAELQSVLEEAEDEIRISRERLLVLSASAPRVVKDDDGAETDWNDHIRREVSDIMEVLEENIVRRYLARVCIDNPEDVTEG